MNDSKSQHEQIHPLYLIDRENLNRLLASASPKEQDIVDLARLMVRYEDFPGAMDLKLDMIKILKLWGISRESLNSRAKAIWEAGFIPGSDIEGSVGSGFDTSDSSNK